MRKLKLSIILSFIFVLGLTLAACGSKADPSTSTPTSNPTQTTTGEKDPNSIPKFSGMAITEKSPLTDQATLNSLRNAKLLNETEEIPPLGTDGEGEDQDPEGVLPGPVVQDPVDAEGDGEEDPAIPAGEEEENPANPAGEGESEDEPKEDDKLAIEVPEDNMPKTPENADVVDNLLPEISIAEGGNVTPFYAEVNQDVFVSVSIVNPNSFAILRFTLNGRVYQSYEFERGSTSELLVLKVNSGDVPGIKEYTIDEIKYVSDVDNQIRDAIIEGNQTVKLSVAYDKVPTASVNNESQDLSSYEATLFISDPLNLVNFEEGNCKLYFYDGENILLEKALEKGSNSFRVDNLSLGQAYQYMVVANYDGLDPSGFSTHLLLSKDVNTSMFVKLTNVATNYDELTFDYKIINRVAQVEGIYLFKDGEAIAEVGEELKFSNLLSNTEYEIRLYFSFSIGEDKFVYFDSFKAKTQAHKIPSINATFKVYESSVEFKVFKDDEENLITLKSVKLYTQNGDFVANASYEDTLIEGLNRNANYSLRFVYSYDLNDGNGEVEAEKAVAFSTTKFVPVVEIKPSVVTKDSIQFDLIVTDPNVVGRVNSIRLYKAIDKSFVNQLNDTIGRSFTKLQSNTLYLVEVGYVYDLDDGNGSQMATFDVEISTAKEQPTFNVNVTALEDGFRIDPVIDDKDNAGYIKSVDVLLDGEVVKSAQVGELMTVDGLLSNVEYVVKSVFEYDLLDLSNKKEIVVTKRIRTLEKNKPVIKVVGQNTTYSSFDIDLSTFDPSNIMTISKVDVYLGTQLVKEITDFEKDMFVENLYSNNRYEIIVYHSYDLNDGNGSKDYESSFFISTLKRDNIVYKYNNMRSGVNSIDFDLTVTDKEKLSTVTAIELFDNDGNLVQSLEDLTVRRFENLELEAFYSIVTTYEFDLNDGNGVQSDKVTIKYGTSGSKIYVNNLSVLNNENPKAGEEVTVAVSMDNPNNLNVTGVFISNVYCPVVDNGSSKDTVIVKFTPETEGGYFLVEVTGYEYESAGVVIQDLLTSDFVEEILIMGDLKVLGFFAISDTYYENYASAYLRILEIENPTGYEIRSLGYNDQTYTNFEVIDSNHILVKEEVTTLYLNKIEYGMDENYTERSFNTVSATVKKYENIVHISTVNDLLAIDSSLSNASYYNSAVRYYILDNDIDASEVKWEGIRASGVFDGNGHTIKNIRTSVIDESTGNSLYYGLFKNFDGIIFDLNVDSLYISVDAQVGVYVGGICASNGRVFNSSITNSTIEVNAPYGSVVGISLSPNYTSGSLGRSTNNYAENLVINLTKKDATDSEGKSYGGGLDAGLICSRMNVMNNDEKEKSAADYESIVIGNSYVNDNGTIRYPLFIGDTDDSARLFIGENLVDREYHIHTNCDIPDIIKSGVAISNIEVEREGYFLSWYDNPEFSGDPISFPYSSFDKLDLYAKWDKYVLANPNYTYIKQNYWDDLSQKTIEAYVISSFGNIDPDAENTFIIGGYYNGKPVVGVYYETLRRMRMDEDGIEQWDKGMNTYTVYILDTVNTRYASCDIAAKAYYFQGKVQNPYIRYNNYPNVTVPKEYEDYYNRYWGWDRDYMDSRYKVKTYTAQNDPFALVCTYAPTDEANAYIKVKLASADNLFEAIKYDFADVPYSFDYDDVEGVKYMNYSDYRFAIIGSKVYAGVDRIERDANFKYIIYSNGDVVIDSLVNKNLTSIDFNELPYNITKISADVFNGSKLESIVLNEGLTSIGRYAFANTQIREIVFPSTLLSLGDSVFYNCDYLTKVVMNNKLITIPSFTFWSCNQLKEVTFSTRLKTIGESAFSDCYNLSNVILPNGVETINNNAFWYSGLTIFVPSTVKTLTRPFYCYGDYNNVTIYTPNAILPAGWRLYDEGTTNHNGIKVIYNTKAVKENNEYYYVVTNNDEIIIQKCKKSNLNVIEFNFEEGNVIEIMDNAFNMVNNITKITLPETLKTIGRYAFSNASSNIIVEIPEGVEVIGEYAFNSNMTLITKALSAKEGWNEKIAQMVLYGVNEIVTGEDFIYALDNQNNAYVLALSKDYEKTVVDFDIPGVTVVSVANGLFKGNRLINTVIVPEGVKSLGAYLFQNANNITSVKLPSTLESIGAYAFQSVYNLRSIIIPENVTRIEQCTFESCSQLNSVTLLGAVTYIGDNAFSYARVNKFEVPDSVLYVGSRGLRLESNCYIIIHSDTKVPEGWSSEYYGSSWDSSLPKVIYDDGKNYVVLNINASYDSGVKTIYENTITDYPYVSLYDNSMIESWYKDPEFQEEVSFPFDATEHITNIYAKIKRYIYVNYNDGMYNYGLTSGYAPLTVSEPQVSKDGSYAEWYLDQNRTVPVTFPYVATESLNFYPKWIKINYQELGDFTYYINRNGQKVLSGYKGSDTVVDLSVIEGLEIIGENVFHENRDIKTVIIPEGVTEIGSNAFWNTTLESVNLPSTIRKIGSGAFGDNNNLKDVTLNEGLVHIGSYAFNNVYARTIAIPSTVETIENCAFRTNRRGLIIVDGEGAKEGWSPEFFGYNGDGMAPTVIYNDDVNYVLLVIDEDYSSSTTILFEETVASAPSVSFNYSVTLSGWYTNKDYTTEATFPFAANSHITYLYAKTARSIWIDYVYGSSGYSLANGLAPLTINEPTISEMDDDQYVEAWYKDSALKQKVEFPYVATESMTLYPKLVSITIVDSGLGYYYYEKEEGKVLYKYRSSSSVADLSELTDFVEIGASAFASDTSITKVVLPNSIKVIGNSAFSGCTALKEVVLNEGLERIADKAFNRCYNLTSITLPSTLKSIGGRAFEECNQLKEIVIPEGVTRIENSTFQYCYQLRSVTLPSTLKYIGSNAFYSCNSLAEITLPNGLSNIESYAFAYCNKLLVLEIPASVTYIGYCGVRTSSNGVVIIQNSSKTPTGWDKNYYGKSDTSHPELINNNVFKWVVVVTSNNNDNYKVAYQDLIREAELTQFGNYEWYTNENYEGDQIVFNDENNHTFTATSHITYVYGKKLYNTNVYLGEGYSYGYNWVLHSGYDEASISLEDLESYGTGYKYYLDRDCTQEITSFPVTFKGNENGTEFYIYRYYA